MANANQSKVFFASSLFALFFVWSELWPRNRNNRRTRLHRNSQNRLRDKHKMLNELQLSSFTCPPSMCLDSFDRCERCRDVPDVVPWEDATYLRLETVYALQWHSITYWLPPALCTVTRLKIFAVCRWSRFVFSINAKREMDAEDESAIVERTQSFGHGHVTSHIVLCLCDAKEFLEIPQITRSSMFNFEIVLRWSSNSFCFLAIFAWPPKSERNTHTLKMMKYSSNSLLFCWTRWRILRRRVRCKYADDLN